MYLLHFDKPYYHARHYIGYAENVEQRVAEHQAGHGARLTQVAVNAGIQFILARTWPGGRKKERALKKIKNAPRMCPICQKGV